MPASGLSPFPVRPTRLPRAFALVLGMLGLAFPIGPAGAQTSTAEHRIKAASIYNFAKFVQWPETRFAEPASPIVIGLLGSGPVANELPAATAGRQAQGRAIVVRPVAGADDLAGVHLLFVSSGAEEAFVALLPALQRHSVLTVGESPRFTEREGIIRFVIESNKVRFEINRGAANDARLQISSHLLKLALIAPGRK